jgi:hypothetical protein
VRESSCCALRASGQQPVSAPPFSARRSIVYERDLSAVPDDTLAFFRASLLQIVARTYYLTRVRCRDGQDLAKAWQSEAVAQALGISVQPLGVREPNDFDQAFEAMIRDTPDAILMVTDSLTILNRKRVFEFAAAHRLPAIYEFDFLVRDGGLMSYGPDQLETFERVAALVDHILKGAKPAELPFEQPTHFRFVLNLKTARSIGLTVPPSLLARADEVIE